jgi:hypothetical protein
MKMKAPLNYFDLVVATVRGLSPIPEFAEYKVDRTQVAEDHIRLLREKYPESSGNEIIDMAIGMGANFLAFTWDKMNPSALTMCGEESLGQLIAALQAIELEKIPGDLIETGVWRGGIPIIMRAFLQSVGNRERIVWLADSFKGLPENSEDPNDQAAHLLLKPLHHLCASRAQVENALDFFGLCDYQVQFLEGWFRETLRNMPDRPLALIRLDGDYYESTRDALVELYPRLSASGFLIVDDYHLPLGCKRAVDEYRQENGIQEPIIKINSQAVYWRKA